MGSKINVVTSKVKDRVFNLSVLTDKPEPVLAYERHVLVLSAFLEVIDKASDMLDIGIKSL